MGRKVLKILISILFLAVAALTAVFAIKDFIPKFWNNKEEPIRVEDIMDKYGVFPFQEEERALPTIDKDGFPIQENRMLSKPIEQNSGKNIERKNNGELPVVMPIVMDINDAIDPTEH